MNENIGLLVVKGREEVKIEPGESLSWCLELLVLFNTNDDK
jgi:hypothetical protein